MYRDRFVSRLTKNSLAMILAGGRGSRLQDLTQWRTKPAVPFGGKFRIIDFPLSNCMNSGIRRVGILTQYKAHSLIRHIQQGWGYLRGELGEFIELLPAQQRIESGWYSGTANAVYQNLDIIKSHGSDHVLILAGDHVYKMDYGPMLAFHVEKDADVTVGCIEIPVSEASAFGIMTITDDLRVRSFCEKPRTVEPAPGKADSVLASMGIYVFSTGFLIDQLILDARRGSESGHDFGGDILPAVINDNKVFAYPFRSGQSDTQAYWRDVGTVDSYWKANMELIEITPELNLYDEDWPIWTYQQQTPPAKFIFNEDNRRGMAIDSMVSGGAIISGASINHSLLFTNVQVDAHSEVEHSVVLPKVRIGKNCRINKAIIDKGAVIPDGTVIGHDPQHDRQRFMVSAEGVTLVTPEMLGQQIHFHY